MSDNSSTVLKSGNLVSGASLIGGAEPEHPPEPPDKTLPLGLPSGRRVALVLGEDGEEVRVHGPDGKVEVTITLTDAGPVVRLSAAKLQLDAVEQVEVNCQDFKVNTTGGVDIQSADEIHMKSPKDVFVEGAVIWLN
ncbi:MAG: hypothetical protein P8R54_23880 [Myxococcota bacterium]|nr:hypothetical protein [Myxococcota bacterium]